MELDIEERLFVDFLRKSKVSPMSVASILYQVYTEMNYDEDIRTNLDYCMFDMIKNRMK